jgi:hypothetical protein
LILVSPFFSHAAATFCSMRVMNQSGVLLGCAVVFLPLASALAQPFPPAGEPLFEMNGLDMDRLRNIQLAMADRQVVFKNDCAECHAKPAIGKTGQPLYEAACANAIRPVRSSRAQSFDDRQGWRRWLRSWLLHHGRS